VAAVLFLIGTAYLIGAFSSSAFNAAGRADVAFRLQLLNTITNVVGFFIAAAIFGTLVAVAIAFVVRGYLLLGLNLYWLRRYVGISLRQYFVQLRGIAVASLAMAGAVLAVKVALVGTVAPAVLLAAEIAGGGVTFLIVIRLVDAPLLADMAGLGRSVLAGGLTKGGKRMRRAAQAAEVTPEADAG
jgi:PST family polysaccharide transporter